MSERDFDDIHEAFLKSLISVGYKSADDVRCTTEEHGNRLDLFFDRYLYEEVVNSPGQPLYSKGELLLSLERTGPADSPTYKATWGKYFRVAGPTALFRKVS